jgi:hypothetical protein
MDDTRKYNEEVALAMDFPYRTQGWASWMIRNTRRHLLPTCQQNDDFKDFFEYCRRMYEFD